MPGENRRIQRVEKELRHLVAGYFLTGLKDPLSCLSSVVGVKVSPDLRHAKVYVSLMGGTQEQKIDWSLLLQQLPEIQRHVSCHLKLKFTPRLQLFQDHSAEEAEKIQGILSQLKDLQKPSTIEISQDESIDDLGD